MEEKELTRDQNPIFYKLWDLKCVKKWMEGQNHLKDWYDYEIYAYTTKDVVMTDWSGNYPVAENQTERVCPTGTKVRIWMVSKFGDVGITDNLINPIGYLVRGLDADEDFRDYEFIERGI